MRTGKIFYGWWMVAAGALAHAVATGLGYFGLSAYFPSLEKEFGWSRTAISGAFSLARVESGLLGPAEGYLIDRLGSRRMILAGTGISAFGFFLLSLVNSLPMLYLVFVLGIMLGSSLGVYVPLSAVVANWFRAKRSLAFGVFRMGPGLAGALVPLVGWAVVHWGWRRAAAASGLMLLMSGIPLALLVRQRPQDYGYLPDGEEAPGDPAIASRLSRAPSEEEGFTLREALNTRAFWLLSGAMSLRHMVTEGVSVHFVILLVDRGWNEDFAAGLLGLSTLISVPGRLGFAWLGDYRDKRSLMIWILIALSLSVFFMGAFSAMEVFIPSMVLYSLAYGGLASLQEPIRADYFGTRYFASIQGVSRTVLMVGTFLGPLMAGFLYDLTRSYALAFGFFAIVSGLATLCMVAARPPAKTGQSKLVNR